MRICRGTRSTPFRWPLGTHRCRCRELRLPAPEPGEGREMHGRVGERGHRLDSPLGQGVREALDTTAWEHSVLER